jgi:hypothetical protein
VQPFTTGFPRADIHELISPDILHQLIKGTFKDHLVDWVVEYINHAHPAAEAAQILADIDRRCVKIFAKRTILPTLNPVSQPHHRFLGSVVSRKAVGLSSGPVMIRKHL